MGRCWRHAREDYPNFVHAGAGVFGVAREREEGGWELMQYFGQSWPQESRDILSHDLRKLAARAEEEGDQAACAEYTLAYRRLEREVINEVTVGGSRYRVVRATPFIRNGPNGPEPPRPSDPDLAPDPADRWPHDPASGIVVDPASPIGLTDGLVLMELLQAGWPEGSVPQGIRVDEAKAALLHPGGVLLPTVHTIGERTPDGAWKPTSMGAHPTPQRAREALARHLRVHFPWQYDLTEAEAAAYLEAGDRVEDERLDEVPAGGKTYRIVRVTRLLRFGPDGPEGPRDSDPEQQLPIHAGLALDEDPASDPDDPQGSDAAEPSESMKRFMRLVEEEAARREKRKGTKDRPGADGG